MHKFGIAAILSHVMKPCASLLCPDWHVNHPLGQCIHAVHTTHPLVT